MGPHGSAPPPAPNIRKGCFDHVRPLGVLPQVGVALFVVLLFCCVRCCLCNGVVLAPDQGSLRAR